MKSVEKSNLIKKILLILILSIIITIKMDLRIISFAILIFLVLKYYKIKDKKTKISTYLILPMIPLLVTYFQERTCKFSGWGLLGYVHSVLKCRGWPFPITGPVYNSIFMWVIGIAINYVIWALIFLIIYLMVILIKKLSKFFKSDLREWKVCFIIIFIFLISGCINRTPNISETTTTIEKTTTILLTKCEDGTLFKECSISKPKYCENGVLLDKCDICGCPPDANCNLKDGICLRVWDLTASNDPDLYLGDFITSITPSDWRDYRPIIDKVNELTEDKSSDYEKAMSIAKWVKNSKKYDRDLTVANERGTVIDIFNSEGGVCYDSAVLTVAMMRTANIPSRIIFPEKGLMHAQTDIYVNNQWKTIDTTYGSGEVDFSSMNQIVTSRFYGGYDELSKELYKGKGEAPYVFFTKIVLRDNYIKDDEKIGWGTVKYPYYSKEEIKKWSDKYPHQGTVYENYPVKYLFYKEECHEADNKSNCAIVSKGSVILGYLDESGKCIPLPETEPVIECSFEPIWSPGIGIIGVTMFAKDLDKSIKFIDTPGWFSVKLPEGRYKIGTSVRHLEQKYTSPVAYVEFKVEEEEETLLKPNIFKKSSEVEQQDFDDFMGLLSLRK